MRPGVLTTAESGPLNATHSHANEGLYNSGALPHLRLEVEHGGHSDGDRAMLQR